MLFTKVAGIRVKQNRFTNYRVWNFASPEKLDLLRLLYKSENYVTYNEIHSQMLIQFRNTSRLCCCLKEELAGGLLEKRLDGTSVSYRITSKGRLFFEKMNELARILA